MMSMDQARHWSKAASFYEAEFVDPYRDDVQSPLHATLRKLAARHPVVADLGCGIGPLLPFLTERFHEVHAVDFAEGMLERARATVPKAKNVSFHRLSFTDLTPLHGTLDLAVAVNSLVLPSIADLEESLRQIHATLRQRGKFVGILPGIDGVHYYTMLLVDRALGQGKPLDVARKNAAALGELKDYDFAFGQFRFNGLEQHFWQPFEIRYRLHNAKFRLRRFKKVHLSWKQFAAGEELKKHPPPWDWFFLAEKT
ncbi:MAG: class I SAM-dependent methyltransferase [Gemmataceae bacterium]